MKTHKYNIKGKCNFTHILTFITHLEHNSSNHSQSGQERHLPHPAQVQILQEEEAHPAQLLLRVGWVAHAVHPLHLQLFDETTTQVAQLVEAELAVIAAHTTVPCT